MKKTMLSLAVLFLTVFCANAQSYTLEWNGELYGDTDTITPESATAAEIGFNAVFNNNSNNGVNIKVVRNEISMLENTSNYFCWGANCDTIADTSSMFVYVPAGASSTEYAFSAHYEIHGAVGISLIEYTFYNIDNPDENVRIVVAFDTSPAAIDENILRNAWVSDLYPNPTTNFVSIDHKLPPEVEEASVKIVNLLGSVVKEQRVDTGNNKTKMDVSGLSGGIYFYSVFVNGDVYCTKKLIVK